MQRAPVLSAGPTARVSCTIGSGQRQVTITASIASPGQLPIVEEPTMSDQTDQTSTATVERVHAPGSPVDHLAPPGDGVTLCGYLGAYPRPVAAPRRLCTLCELRHRDRETVRR